MMIKSENLFYYLQMRKIILMGEEGKVWAKWNLASNSDFMYSLPCSLSTSAGPSKSSYKVLCI